MKNIMQLTKKRKRKHKQIMRKEKKMNENCKELKK